MAEELLRVSELRTYFFTARGIVRAVDGVSLVIQRGESVGIAGESGCGKSTLAYSIMRVVPPPGRIVGGRVEFQGKNVLEVDEEEFRRSVRWRGISMVFQGAMNALNPVYTVGNQLAEIFVIHKGYSKKEAIEEAKRLLKLVGIDPKRASSYPFELSGGMRQRVVIAMALALDPSLLIADEPTTALDVVTQAQIMDLLKELKDKLKLSIVLISHDLSLIAEIADKVAIMYAGQVVEDGPSDLVYTNPLHPYTSGLISAVPRLRGEIRDLAWIPGQPPDLTNPPPGCRFAPRCPLAQGLGNRCFKEAPPVIESGGGRRVRCWLYE